MKWRFEAELLTSTEPAFRTAVDCWLRKALHGNPKSWQELLRAMPGVYPLEAWAAMGRIAGLEKHLAPQDGPKESQVYPDPFPNAAEHPLDYEWRFSTDAVGSLLNLLKASAVAENGYTVSCFGCPSIYVAGIQEYPEWSWHLFDRRAGCPSASRGVQELMSHDLNFDLPLHSTFDVAVVDPPWYVPITKRFIRNAQRTLKDGGLLILSMAGIGTRASATTDQQDILQWCEESGLRIESRREGGLQYKTPFFEQNSLRAAGFDLDVPLWRRGDLFIFRKTARVSQAGPPGGVGQLTFGETSKHFFVRGIKVILRYGVPVPEGRAICATENLRIWRSEVLPSVSSRFPGRDSANLITSGNRFLWCPDLPKIERELGHASSDWETWISQHADDETIVGDLCRVLSKEQSERSN